MTLAYDTNRDLIRSASDRPKVRRSVIESMLTFLFVLLWVPSLSAPGGTDMNLFLFLPMLMLLMLLGAQGGVRFGFGMRWDAQMFVLIMLSVVLVSAMSIISLLYADNPVLVFRVTSGQVFALAILVAVITLPTDDDGRIRRIIDLFVWGAALSGLYATASYFIPALNALAFGDADRTSAFFKHPNQFGIAMSMAAPVTVGLLVVDKRKLFRVLQVLAIFMGLVMSGSKTNLATSAGLSFLILVIALFKMGYFQRRPGMTVMILTLAFGAGFVGFNVLGELNPRAQRLLLATASGEAISSWDARNTLWAISVQDMLDHPWTGVGAGQRVGSTGLNHSHNVVLDYVRTMGIPGGAMLLMLMVPVLLVSAVTVLKTLRPAPSDPYDLVMPSAIALGASGYLFTNQFSDSFGPSTLPLFFQLVAMLFFYRRQLQLRARAQAAPR